MRAMVATPASARASPHPPGAASRAPRVARAHAAPAASHAAPRVVVALSAPRAAPRRGRRVAPRAASPSDDDGRSAAAGGGGGAKTSIMSKADELLEKVGLSLGPIGMTLGESKRADDGDDPSAAVSAAGKAAEMMDKAGVSLGPIGMTLGESKPSGAGDPSSGDAAAASAADRPSSIASMTTAEWRAKYVNADGTVDLFLMDEYNAASRLAGCVDPATLPDGVDPAALANIENIAWSGLPTDAVTGVRHAVKVTDHETGETLELDVPENRYVLFEAEQAGWELPNACRMGCCTKCAVKVTKGTLAQPEALGLSKRYRDEGYALLCVSTALSDVECVTQDEEEVYQMQFGELFQQLATDKDGGAVVRDDFALEIADMDE